MKAIKYLLILAIFFAACQSEDEKHFLKCCRTGQCGMYTSDFSKEGDSIEIAEIMGRREPYYKFGKEKIGKIVFAKSTVKLLDINKDFKDYRNYEYGSCSAVMNGDTVVVSILHNHEYSDLRGVKTKEIKISYWSSDFETEIIHVHNNTCLINSNYMSRVFPKSDIYYDHLQINQEKFEKGDTICGIISIRGKLRDRVQMVGGSFKTIIF